MSSAELDIFRILLRGAHVRGRRATEKEALAREAARFGASVQRETDFFKTKRIRAEEPEPEPDEPSVFHAPSVQTVEQAEELRRSNRCKVQGTDVPLPVGLFEDLVRRFDMDKKLLDNLVRAGFVEPTPVQSEAIPISLTGRDLITCAPTGSGKTIAFAVPLLQLLAGKKGLRGLVIAPTNELALQIFGELEVLAKGLSLHVALLLRPLAAKLEKRAVAPLALGVLVTTPLRLIDLVKSEVLSLGSVEQLVIDEADRLFAKGFVEQTDHILASCTHPALRKSIYSATIPLQVEELARLIMRDQVRVIVGHKEAAASTIDQRLVFTGSEEGKLLAIRQMIQAGEFKPPVIIFLQQIGRAKALYNELIYDKLNVDVIHAEKTPKQRDEVIRRFKNGDIWVLITTDVLARGVDFKGVNLVINYDVPLSAQDYVHRIGRTGRGGRKGTAVTLFTKEDNLAIKPVVNVMKQSGCHDGFPQWMQKLPKLRRFEKHQVKAVPLERRGITTAPHLVKKELREARIRKAEGRDKRAKHK